MSAPALSSDTSPGLDSGAFAAHLAGQSHLPAWWLGTQKEAWNQFKALPPPARTDERWRFSTLSGLRLDGFQPAGRPTAPVPARPDFPVAASLIFSSRRLAARLDLPAALARQGVIFAPLEDALRHHGDLVRRYFQQYPTHLGSDKFVALNTAFATAGAVLYVPRGVELPAPVYVQHTLSGDHQAAFPHTLVILEDQAKATLVEYFVSAERGAAHLVSGVNDLHAGPGAQLTYIGVQDWSRDTLAFHVNSTAVERDARVLSLNVHLGGRQVRQESESRLLGQGAHSEMLSLAVVEGTQELDQRTLQTHVAPHTTSNLLYKNALLDRARTIFSGLIVVEPDAQRTDAYQGNRNLMLSDDAEANSLPGLKIQANDVRCTHGAAMSSIDPNQLYYLQSRGLPRAQARELLTFGFFEEVLDQLTDQALHTALSALIQSKFQR